MLMFLYCLWLLSHYSYEDRVEQLQHRYNCIAQSPLRVGCHHDCTDERQAPSHTASHLGFESISLFKDSIINLFASLFHSPLTHSAHSFILERFGDPCCVLQAESYWEQRKGYGVTDLMPLQNDLLCLQGPKCTFAISFALVTLAFFSVKHKFLPTSGPLHMLVQLALSCHSGPSSDNTTQLRLLGPSHS